MLFSPVMACYRDSCHHMYRCHSTWSHSRCEKVLKTRPRCMILGSRLGRKPGVHWQSYRRPNLLSQPSPHHTTLTFWPRPSHARRITQATRGDRNHTGNSVTRHEQEHVKETAVEGFSIHKDLNTVPGRKWRQLSNIILKWCCQDSSLYWCSSRKTYLIITLTQTATLDSPISL